MKNYMPQYTVLHLECCYGSNPNAPKQELTSAAKQNEVKVT